MDSASSGKKGGGELRHFVESQQLDRDMIMRLFADAKKMKATPFGKIPPVLRGKILGTLFYEPSTRTRWSFESAMLRLGGSTLGTENAAQFSSAVKGESLEDTIRIVSKYADCIVIRHNEEGSAKRAAELSSVPVINGGDGRGQHPTQSLLDLFTIHEEFGKIDGIKVAMVGDLSNGRTVRSLAYLLGKFSDIEIRFVSQPHLGIKSDIKEYLAKRSVKFSEGNDLNAVLPGIDVVYMTRLQKERMSDDAYKRAKGKYSINVSNLKLLRPAARIMHPLPKLEEINLPIEVERKDPRIAYFRQAENGLYIRMALLKYVLNAE